MTDLLADIPADGPAAPPRANGELLFEQPWESQIFGVTMALYGQQLFAWSEFQAALIAAVKRWEDAHPDGAGYRYYERWYEALESLLGNLGVIGVELVDRRAAEFAARPAGHDHDHDHGHHP